MKPTTNTAIFENVKVNGFITEREILLLKRRSNAEGRDLFNYDLLDTFDFGVPVTPEQGVRGLHWLQGLIKRNGEPKAGQNLGYREIEIIKTSTANDFTFCGFYAAGNGWYTNFVPVYSVGGMDYYVEGGKIVVVG